MIQRAGVPQGVLEMKATVMYGAKDVRVETVPDARLVEPTDALVRVTRACICGSDLWPYNSMAPTRTGNRMGHEFIGVVEAIGAEVRTLKKGDLVGCAFRLVDQYRQRAGERRDRAGPRADRRARRPLGPAPVRAYMHELLPDVLEGRIEPGLVFDRVTNMDGVPEAVSRHERA